MGRSIATATEAAYGASALTRLLHVDANFAAGTRLSDDPGSLPQPFNDNVKGGLFAALHTCLHVLSMELECLDEMAQQAAMAENDGTAGGAP